MPLNLQDQIKSLQQQQLTDWPLARQNYAALRRVLEKTFAIHDFELRVQYNPERIRSSAAQTDPASIRKRPCFLCASNRPTEQLVIDYRHRYQLLVNPFPIFPQHLTIVGYEHIPQRISGRIADMLDLAADLPDYSIFYNGPQCGASAPDHFHFQAATKNTMPVDREIDQLTTALSDLIFQTPTTRVYATNGNYLRQLILLTSRNKTELSALAEQIIQLIPCRETDDEPLLNLLANTQNGAYRLLLFPREKQRPDYYFRTDETQILMSPATVEMGGLAILPRQEDFEKISLEILADIYKQVSLNETAFEQLKQSISNQIKFG